jgi:glycosyltransferase involved in cell wall biosynthesis
MQQRVAESPLLAGLPCTKIPFGVDTDVFRPIPKAEARRALGVPEDARPLAIRWAPHYLLKGTRYAEEALMRLPSGLVTDLICFDTPGGSEVERLQQQYRVTTIRNYSDPELIATGLAAADAFLMPSLAETFGLMAVEAMACGTPPIVFEGTSLPAVIGCSRSTPSTGTWRAILRSISVCCRHDVASGQPLCGSGHRAAKNTAEA